MTDRSQTTENSARHPAWGRYNAARRAWERTTEESLRHHREMQDAAEELVRAGEMRNEPY